MSVRRALLRKNSGVTQYKLNFDSTYNDYVSFGAYSGGIAFNNVIIEVKFSNCTDTSSTVQGIFGQHKSAAAVDRWFIARRGSTNTFFCRFGTKNLDFTSSASSGIIRLEGDGSGTRSYLDGVLQTTDTVIFNSANTSYLLNIGAQNDSSGTSVDTSATLDGTIHYASIDNGTTVTMFALDEGSGATTTSDQGDVGTISTTNGGGLSYINSTMWEAE